MIQTRQLRLDVEALTRARRKLQTLQAAVKSAMNNEDEAIVAAICHDMSIPTPRECKVMLDLIRDARSRLYPTEKEISIHAYHIYLLGRIDSVHEAEQFNEIANKVQEYEHKYCK